MIWNEKWYESIWYDLIDNIKYDMTYLKMMIFNSGFNLIWYDAIGYRLWYMQMRLDYFWIDTWKQINEIWNDSKILYDSIWFDMIRYDSVWFDMIWYEMIWYDRDMISYHQNNIIFKKQLETCGTLKKIYGGDLLDSIPESLFYLLGSYSFKKVQVNVSAMMTLLIITHFL